MSTMRYRIFCMDSQCLLGGDCGPAENNRTTLQHKLPKWIKWASLLPNMQRVIDEKLANGFMPTLCDTRVL